jgi:hypothetical protein
MKQHRDHLSHKQHAVLDDRFKMPAAAHRLLKTKKFVKNSCEFLIDFDSNQLWHKSLKQNQPRKISTIQAIWRTIRRYFESDSRQFESNSRAIRDNWRYGLRHC